MHSTPTSEPETASPAILASAVGDRLIGADSAGLWMLVTIEAPGARITFVFTKTTATPSEPTATDTELAAQLITELAFFRGLAGID